MTYTKEQKAFLNYLVKKVEDNPNMDSLGHIIFCYKPIVDLKLRFCIFCGSTGILQPVLCYPCDCPKSRLYKNISVMSNYLQLVKDLYDNHLIYKTALIEYGPSPNQTYVCGDYELKAKGHTEFVFTDGTLKIVSHEDLEQFMEIVRILPICSPTLREAANNDFESYDNKTLRLTRIAAVISFLGVLASIILGLIGLFK